ncbi:radical SAM/SPASM domain Clo7bot peptide maturase [Bacteroidia bacterium]|nr:radical SAM/SPASM domain Clo7bot peptide maturase [Bacteroidia bacterium]GHV40307.1 radical SAM/SPASM domain Clo7bot peptide maturase [Bacteroidia bacterium]
MKISRYTFLFHINNINFFVYNSLSNALVEIDKQSYFDLKENENNIEASNIVLDEELYNTLLENGIVTKNDEDDYLKYKAIIKKMREQTKFLHLTLAPTMDCCFNCFYCFEKYKDKKYMTSEIIDSIIKYINAQNCIEIIKLTWFGGEPLMGLKEMIEFNEKLSKTWTKTIDYDIITTGYHIDKNVIEILKKIGISSMQITIDGTKETHNQIKFLPDSEDVFSKVWNNIKLLYELAPDIKVTIRVNLTKKNAHEYEQLLELFRKTFIPQKNITISPSFVIDRGTIECKSGDSPASTLFNHNERSKHMLMLAHKGIKTPYVRYPNRQFGECAIRNNVAISFDPEGYAYKCWEVIGNKKYAIGRLNSEGELTEFNETNINRQLYGADPLEDAICVKCKYLPICGGGCPIQRIQNKFENGGNNPCIYYKGYLPEFLKFYIEQNRGEPLMT